MILGFFTLLVAIAISAVAAYYSILGLIAIFAAAALPVIVMGGVLEAGKLMAAVWLHKNWNRASAMYKMYLVPAVAFLMLITSMGVFGFLSKAHLDQGIPTADISAQVALIDERIKAQQESIDVTKKVIVQLDSAVDQVLERSKSEQGARRAAELRKSQAKERSQLQNDIDAAQAEIAKLREQKSEITIELRQLEAEVGPLKYVAELIYGEDPAENLLDRAVRWVIILIVIVFDPLAVVLLLAATRQFEWAKTDRERKNKQRKLESTNAEIDQLTEQVAILTTQLANTGNERETLQDIITTSSKEIERLEHDNKKLTESIAKLQEEINQTPSSSALEEQLAAKESKISADREQLRKQEVELIELRRALLSTQKDYEKVSKLYEKALDREYNKQKSAASADSGGATEMDRQPNVNFGTEFIKNPAKGDLFIRTDFTPTRLFKWNGDQWTTTGKASTDAYLTDEYLTWLEQQVSEGANMSLSTGENAALEQRKSSS